MTPDSNHHRPSPSEPTTAPPGSPEKLAVLSARFAAQVGLWHPDDERLHRAGCMCGLCDGRTEWAEDEDWE